MSSLCSTSIQVSIMFSIRFLLFDTIWMNSLPPMNVYLVCRRGGGVGARRFCLEVYVCVCEDVRESSNGMSELFFNTYILHENWSSWALFGHKCQALSGFVRDGGRSTVCFFCTATSLMNHCWSGLQTPAFDVVFFAFSLVCNIVSSVCHVSCPRHL